MAIIKRSAATDNPNIEIPSTPEQIDVLSAEALMEALQGDDLEQILRAIHQLEAADSVEFQQHQAALFTLLDRDTEQNPCSDAVFSLLAIRNNDEITTRLIPCSIQKHPIYVIKRLRFYNIVRNSWKGTFRIY